MTSSDLDRLDIPSVLKDTDGTCFAFAQVLAAKATEVQAAGDDLGGRILALLGDICSYFLRPGIEREPFGPRIIYGPPRTGCW